MMQEYLQKKFSEEKEMRLADMAVLTKLCNFIDVFVVILSEIKTL